MTHKQIARKIAAKARDLWIKKAATLRFEAELLKLEKPYAELTRSQAARSNADAFQAEQRAIEWDAKVNDTPAEDEFGGEPEDEDFGTDPAEIAR